MGATGNEILSTGSVQGKSVQFTVRRETPRGEISMDFNGLVTDDGIQGQMQMMTISLDWTATRME